MSAPIVKVIVDGPFEGSLDYLNKEELHLEKGMRCIVSLGNRKVIGLVVGFEEKSEIEEGKLKKVIGVPDEINPLGDSWLRLTNFAASYYLSGWGKTAINALPKFFRSLPNSRHLSAIEKIRNKKEKSRASGAAEKLVLNPEQKAVVDDFGSLEGFSASLLFGVTGSGKTEVYMQIMEEELKKNPHAQVLLLVPEINLTPQLVERVASRFRGERVSVWHSGLSEGEKTEAWLNMHEERSRILIGTRLSIFASIPNLSLIIVDEEHDPSFKAKEGVRYSARDLAVKRAQLEKIKVLLGSATPSLETFSHALNGKYRLYRLPRRAVEHATLPSLVLADTNIDKEVEGFTSQAKAKIEDELKKGKQSLIFLNRRGYAPVVTCGSCGWLSSCPHCSAYAVYHKTTHRLTCHHCGWSVPMIKSCPDCGSLELKPVGRGTQRVEEELGKTFPQASLLRIDQDSTQRKGALEEALAKVHKGEVDILLGTQMVSKGHDFQNIALVVVLNADLQLLSPDLRARERLFSVLMQVSGRAGRAGEKGEVIVQTKFPEDPFFEYLRQQDYEGFARNELGNRRNSSMPPFSSLALLVGEGKSIDDVLKTLKRIKEEAQMLGQGRVRVFDPVPQAITRIQDIERGQLLFEAHNKKDMQAFLKQLNALLKTKKLKERWFIDVDPLNF